MTAFCSKPLFMSELRDVLSQPYRVKKEETPAAPYRFEGKKVLLVEDNLLNQEIAQAILQDAGFTVYTADDGDVAVERLQDSKQGEFDLVLMDIQMPKMDGYAATRQIRTLPSDVANVPIVAMTANAFEEDKQKAIRAGMNAHIAKPIEAGRLMETLSHILTKRIPKVQLSGSFLSAAEFADFILNEPTRRSGELVDAANARKVAAVDGVRGGNARDFTHEDGGDADALRA